MMAYLALTLLLLFTSTPSAGTQGQAARSIQDPVRQAIFGRNSDIEFATACGPIAIMTACEVMGVPTTLDEAIDACHWSSGQQSSLAEMIEGLSALTGHEFELRRVDQERDLDAFQQLPSGAVAILRGASSDLPMHAVVVLEVGGDEGWVTVDFPALVTQLSPDQIRRRWTGLAIVPADPRTHLAAWPLTMLAAMTLLWVSWRRRRRSCPQRRSPRLMLVLLAGGGGYVIPQVSIGGNGQHTVAVPEIVRDVGRLDPERIHVESVTLKNDSDSPVVLDEPVVSCGACVHVATAVKGTRLAPGAEIAISVEISARGKLGRFEQWVVLAANEHSIVLLRVRFRGQVASYWCSETLLQLGLLHPGERITARVALCGDTLSRAEHLSVVPDGAFSSGSIEVLPDAIATYNDVRILGRMTLTWIAPLAAGECSGNLQIAFEDRGVPRLVTVPVFAVVADGATVPRESFIGVHVSRDARRSEPFSVRIPASGFELRVNSTMVAESTDPTVIVDHVALDQQVLVVTAWLRIQGDGALIGVRTTRLIVRCGADGVMEMPVTIFFDRTGQSPKWSPIDVLH